MKKFLRNFGTLVLAGAVVLGSGAAVDAAPKAKEAKEVKETGRTAQDRWTGLISVNEVLDLSYLEIEGVPVQLLPRGAREVTLTGTVQIDGPELHFAINGSTENIELTKVGDKTWTFSTTGVIGDRTGLVDFDFTGHTYYSGGQPYQQTHTNANKFTKQFYVPSITSVVGEVIEWTYDRSSNQFTIQYNEVTNWDDGGDADVVVRTATVNGDSTKFEIPGTETILGEEDIPTTYQGFTFLADPAFEYDETTETYSVTFDIEILDSKGEVSTQPVTKSGLIPGQLNTVSHTIEDDFVTIAETQEYTAPAKPETEVVVVASEIVDIIVFLDTQSGNQWKVRIAYKVEYSDGTIDEEFTTISLEGTLRSNEHHNHNHNHNHNHITSYTIQTADLSTTITINGATQTATDENGKPIKVEPSK